MQHQDEIDPMGELIEFICDFFGIQATSTIAAIDMATELSEIKNHVEYIQFIKKYITLDEVKYLKAYPKFTELTKRYKQIENQAMNHEEIEKMIPLVEKIAEKVRSIDTMVLNYGHINHQWEGFKVLGKQYFGEKEILALSSIGTPHQCVRLQRSVSGRDMLREKLESIFIDRVTVPQLESPKNRVTALIQSAIKK